ncbi:MAG: SUMF1/EgtB/PvdO family nonheme iron enzyme, partial [Deltaproteobacteria bacterium]|nr:SUMF1/EgtB/PvdO family nonheme iron enzyme [Deltaproteobacteria bacterium]
ENNQIRGNGYRAFIEHLLEEGRYNDALQFLPRVKVNPTGDEPFTMPEFFKMIRGVGWKASIQRLRETLSGTHNLWKIRVEGRGKKVRYVLEDPITDFNNPASNRDPEGDPILPRQPISSITANAAEEYIRWRSARDGRTYRLPHPDEMEKATRGSFPLTYPWGYDFNPNFLASRMAHKGIEDCFPHPVGEHPLGEAWSRDRSIYGLVEPLGNIREFVQAPDNLPNLIGLFGGSIRVPYGPFFLPAARVYQNRTAAEDGIGSLRLILDLPPPDPESR